MRSILSSLSRFNVIIPGVLLGLIGWSASAEDAAPVKQQGTFIGAKHTEYPDWFKQSFLELAEDVDEAAESGRRVVILFYQDGCPYCYQLVERNLTQKDIETALRTHFDVIALNIWGDREVLTTDGRSFTEKQLAAAMRVQFTPTLVFLNEEGRPALRLNGYVPPARFKTALDYVSQGLEDETSFRDYFARAQGGAESTGRSTNELPFCAQGDVDLRGVPEDSAIALLFEQGDCPMCDDLRQGPMQDADVRRTADRLRCQQLDMWSGQSVTLPDGTATTARELAQVLDVKYAPTLVMLDHQGREIIRGEAEFKTFHVHGILEYAASGDYREQPRFQRWLEARAEHLVEQGIDVDIWR